MKRFCFPVLAVVTMLVAGCQDPQDRQERQNR